MRSGQTSKISGLRGNHAYCIVRAVECNGKRFVILREPLGDSQWTGPWSDGSKEWTSEWLAFLPELGHSFEDDGQFIMLCRWQYTLFTTLSVDGLIVHVQTRTSFRLGTTWTVSCCSTHLGLCLLSGYVSHLAAFLRPGPTGMYLVCDHSFVSRFILFIY